MSGVRRRTKKKTRRREQIVIDHNGIPWESYEGSSLWIWTPYVEHGDFTAINVYDLRPQFGISLTFGANSHDCASLEDAFDLGVELVLKRALLDCLCERSRWRIRELERCFGSRLR